MFLDVSCTISGMAGTEWKRLGDLIVRRRIDLGMKTTKALAEASGLTSRMLGDIENARRTNYAAGTRAQIENALRWAPGSIGAILTGGDPTSLSAEEVEAISRKRKEFHEVKRQLGEIYDAMQRQPDEASVRAEGRIRSAARLLDSATDALAQRDHARAIEDLDTSVVVIRSTITAIEDIALQKGLLNADQSSTDTDPSAQSDASETGDEDEEVKLPDDAKSRPVTMGDLMFGTKPADDSVEQGEDGRDVAGGQ